MVSSYHFARLQRAELSPTSNANHEYSTKYNMPAKEEHICAQKIFTAKEIVPLEYEKSSQKENLATYFPGFPRLGAFVLPAKVAKIAKEIVTPLPSSFSIFCGVLKRDKKVKDDDDDDDDDRDASSRSVKAQRHAGARESR
jgi:hypothetical protein